MSQYRKFHTQDPDSAQEMEYNLGRLFHQIGQPSCAGKGLWTDAEGLFSHVARHYKKVLEIAEKRVGEASKVRDSFPLSAWEAELERKPRIICP